MNDNFDVYICNSSVDNKVAMDLRQFLIDKGLHPFMAPCDVPAGTIKADAIMQAISRCPLFIIIVSENSCKSMRVLNEIDEAARTRTRFIPFRIDDTSIPARMRYYLQAFECINGTIEPRKQFDMLFNAVLSNLPVSRRQEVVSPPKPQQKEETPVSSHSNNRIFVSYSHKDKKKVYPLVEKIEHTLGVPCWIDTSGIMSSDRFIGEIRKAIDASEIVLYMYSDNAAKSSWTMKEINYANSKDKRIVPIVLEGNTMRGDSAFMFSDVNFIPISQEGQKTKLLADLAVMLGISAETNQSNEQATSPQSQAEVIEKTEKDKHTIHCEANEKVYPISKDEREAAVHRKVSKKTIGIIAISILVALCVIVGLFAHHEKETGSVSTVNGHEFVDLGLSVKWATCNVGAASAEEFGEYFAWGKTSSDTIYVIETCDTRGMCLEDIAGDSIFDVARASWGGPWRMPTLTEIQELRDSCDWIWCTVNCVNGFKVTSKMTGQYIFLPAAGYYSGKTHYSEGEGGRYWSSTPYMDEITGEYKENRAWNIELCLGGDGPYHILGWGDRYIGRSIRPVFE